MFRKLISYTFILLLFIGYSQAYSMCFNVNLPVEGVITTTEQCEQLVETANLTGAQCLKGTLTSLPQYSIEIATSSLLETTNNPSVKYVTGNVVIKSTNGAEIYGTNGAVTNENNGESAELLTISGGTGPFTNASGDWIVDANYDYTNKTYNATMKGQICIN